MTPSTLLFASLVALVATGCKPPCSPSDPVSAVASTESPATTPCDRGRILRRVVLQLREHSGWGPVQMSGVPSFTLYEDGLVVYADGTGETARAMQAHLSAEQTYALVDYANAKLAELPERIAMTHGTDQPEASISVTHQGRIYAVSVYGFEAGRGAASVPSAPFGFAEVHAKLASYVHPEGEPWRPDELEVVLFRKDDAKAEPRAWPEVLPLPPAGVREPRPRTMGRSGQAYAQPIRYRVDGELESQLASTLPPVEQLQTFAWNGAAWLVRYERVVPGSL